MGGVQTNVGGRGSILAWAELQSTWLRTGKKVLANNAVHTAPASRGAAPGHRPAGCLQPAMSSGGNLKSEKHLEEPRPWILSQNPLKAEPTLFPECHRQHHRKGPVLHLSRGLSSSCQPFLMLSCAQGCRTRKEPPLRWRISARTAEHNSLTPWEAKSMGSYSPGAERRVEMPEKARAKLDVDYVRAFC